MHRLRAAALRGQQAVDVEFFEGGEADAFIEAVRANVAHGLPLSLADREAAAVRIITSHPHHSDRAVAAIVGLAAKTVATLRRRMGKDAGQAAKRVGRDGRSRPLSSEQGRLHAADVLAGNPRASLREVARTAGLSPATVRDVRDRIRRGEDPVPPGQRSDRSGREARLRTPNGGPRQIAAERDRHALIEGLRKDPSLRLSESGRELLRWLSAQAKGPSGWEKVLESIPSHCAYVVVEMARGCAAEWSAFANKLEQRLHDFPEFPGDDHRQTAQ